MKTQLMSQNLLHAETKIVTIKRYIIVQPKLIHTVTIHITNKLTSNYITLFISIIVTTYILQDQLHNSIVMEQRKQYITCKEIKTYIEKLKTIKLI